jgi:hypothetical protein
VQYGVAQAIWFIGEAFLVTLSQMIIIQAPLPLQAESMIDIIHSAPAIYGGECVGNV